MPKLILIGDSGVGKSSLIKSLVYYKNESSIMKMRPTIGVQFITVMIENQIVEVCDIDGHSSFSTINLSHFNEANGIIVVFDVNIRSSFENALSLILEIEKTSTVNQGPKVYF
jgi:small GTP-binding protein